jgi:uncharacterized protein
MVGAALLRALDRHGALAIAVSGGVDSMTLAHVAWRFARQRPVMFHAAGPAVPATARQRIEAHAAREGWVLRMIDAGEISDARYRANPLDRCYYCKTNLYARIRETTDRTIASGTNLDDLGDFRPGLAAAAERGVVHPWVEAGVDKAAVYRLAAALDLGDLERLPAQPCLSSRVETGIAIEVGDLAFIESVESGLAALRGGEAVHRCRITREGVVVELGSTEDASMVAAVAKLARDACRREGRPFAGVRRYVMGSAFLRPRHAGATAERPDG